MKINIELPEWCDTRHIYIMAGIELAAVRIYGENRWKIKTVRCNQCGKCCEYSKYTPSFDSIKGYCPDMEILGEERRCSLSINRPFACCTGDPMTIPDGPWKDCCIEYKVIEDQVG